jgi:hypothetical protein
MPKQKASNSGTFLPASLMYFLSGKLMQLRSGVDSLAGYLFNVNDGTSAIYLSEPLAAVCSVGRDGRMGWSFYL